MQARAIVIGATLVTVLFAGIVDAAPAKKALVPSVAASVKHDFVPAGLTKAAPEPSWGAALPSVSVKNNNTGDTGSFRLYTDHGSIDLDRAKQFMTLVNGPGGKLDSRLVQLAFRAAYHFSAEGHAPS